MRGPEIGDRVMIVCGNWGLTNHVGKTFTIVRIRDDSIEIDDNWYAGNTQWVFETELIKALI
jgi:hypothetical protein